MLLTGGEEPQLSGSVCSPILWGWRLLVFGMWRINLHHQSPPGLCSPSIEHRELSSPRHFLPCLPALHPLLRPLISPPSSSFPHSCEYFLRRCLQVLLGKNLSVDEGFRERSTKLVFRKCQRWDLQRIWKLLRYPKPSQLQHLDPLGLFEHES